MKITADQIMAGTLAFGTVSFTAYKFIELHRKKKAVKTIESLADHIQVDLDDPYVRDYVEKAVDKEISKAANKAANDIVEFHKQAIRTAVIAEIKTQKAELSSGVKNEISRKVGELNVNDIKKEALAEAKEMAANKLKADMEDILDNYKDGLDNLTTIYKSISEKAIASAVKSTPFTLDVRL